MAAPRLVLETLGHFHGRLQHDGDVAGDLVAAERENIGQVRRTVQIGKGVGRATADVDQQHAQLLFVPAQHGRGGGQRLQDDVVGLEAGAVDAADDVLCRGDRAGDDVDLGLQPHAHHPDRIPYAVLLVDGELLRDHVDDLPVHGYDDRLGGIDHALHVVARDLPVPAGDGDDPSRVDSFDVAAGDARERARDFTAGHHLRGLHGVQQRAHGGVDVDDHAAAQSPRRGGADADDLKPALVADLRDDRAHLAGADVQPDDHVVPCHATPSPQASVDRAYGAATCDRDADGST